ncbi:MAG: HDIG domain-containing protein [Clostridiales bacterium]|nr:HDIG domain-containing protein [Clostridiales bacterium]
MGSSKLFADIGKHLENDRKPSIFLNDVFHKPEFNDYPFSILKKLEETKQSPKHHPEGNVWIHTLLVVDEAALQKEKSSDPNAFMWAALLHDIGKTVSTTIRNGRITAYDHDKTGAVLAEKILTECTTDKGFIRAVCALVRYHMHVFYVTKNLPYADIAQMKQQCDVHDIALLGYCDRCGRTNVKRNDEGNTIKIFLKKIGLQP